MKILELSHGSNLLLVFDGFGGSPERAEAVRGIAPGAVWYVYDYTDGSFPINTLAEFEKIELAAWSLGVYEAARTLAGIKLAKAVAVNGTLSPVDAASGIDPAIFEATAKNWSDTARRKFNRRAGIPEEYASQRPPEEEKAELEAIGRRFDGNPEPENIFETVFIGLQDRIFPAKNQRQFWSRTNVSVVETAMPHYPWAPENQGAIWTNC